MGNFNNNFQNLIEPTGQKSVRIYRVFEQHYAHIWFNVYKYINIYII